MTTQNKAVTCYLPKDIEDFITGYCNEYGITRKDKEGVIYPSLGTGIIELLKLLAYNPELVGSPLPDTVPSTISEAAIEAKIEDILEKKLSNLPDNVPSIELVELQARLETLEQLLRLQQSASIANHPGLTSIDGSVEPANTSPLPTGEPDRPATAIEDSEKKIMATVGGSESLDTSPVPPSPDLEYLLIEHLLKREREASIANHPPDEPVTVEDVEPDSTVETGEGAIKYLAGDNSPMNDAGEGGNGATSEVPPSPAKKKGLTDSELARHLGIDKSNITRWKQKGEPTQKYRDKWEFRGRLWYEKD